MSNAYQSERFVNLRLYLCVSMLCILLSSLVGITQIASAGSVKS